MKRKSNRLVPKRPCLRTVELKAGFSPNNANLSNEKAFSEFWLEALEHTQKLKKKGLEKDKARLIELKNARNKTAPVFQKVFQNELSPENAAAECKRLVPNKAILREVFETWERAFKSDPKQVARRKAAIARQEIELAKSERILKAQGAFIRNFGMISDAIEEGNVEAAKLLVNTAIQIVGLLEMFERKKPEVFGSLARKDGVWPVLAHSEPGWEKMAIRRVELLRVGADLSQFRSVFRSPRGVDENLPARQWAKAAVRTIESTRFRMACIHTLIKDLGSPKALVSFCIRTGWNIAIQPDWVGEAISLKTFCSESLPSWKRVIRHMIRDQLPDFHLGAEWNVQRNTATANGRATKGEIQNAILDDMTSALARIAPNAKMPK